MKKPHIPDVRKLLRDNPAGMTVTELHARLPQINKPNTVRKCLERMPDAYIDRWTEGRRGQFHAVWCVVAPPPHCPHPGERYIRTEWRTPCTPHTTPSPQ